MSISTRTIYVFSNWAPIVQPTLIGRLFASPIGRKEVFRFEYEKEWLHSAHAFQFDPELQLYAGPMHKTDGTSHNFRSFLDSCPDRWGRTLMQRREAIYADKENRKAKTLLESDYLLGVHDSYRMGALRFSLHPAGPFLDDNEGMAAPPISSLPELAYASKRLIEDNSLDHDEMLKWIKMLIAPGGSLGGARPKASVTAPNGSSLIAKFPGRDDPVDVAAWEYLAYLLASQAGVTMAQSELKRFGHSHHTFLTQRFDRTPQGRLHFSSAMTQVEKYDGDEDSSYLDLAEFITKHSVSVKSDLSQLWRRIVFNIAISNTDDHLRNHGFLLATQSNSSGWSLSPAYDINPSIDKSGLYLNINEHNNSLNYELAFEVAELFQLSKREATIIYDNVMSSVTTWRSIADKLKIGRAEQILMQAAFNV